jgi:hypothetical protein
LRRAYHLAFTTVEYEPNAGWFRLPSSRLQFGLAVLVLAQAAHSVEECVGRLWESHPLARFVAGLVSSDVAQGFVIANLLIVGFGAWCVLWPMRYRWRVATSLAWFWVIVEIANALAHSLWSLLLGEYTPGLATVPVLMGAALYLGLQLQRASPVAVRAAAHKSAV